MQTKLNIWYTNQHKTYKSREYILKRLDKTMMEIIQGVTRRTNLELTTGHQRNSKQKCDAMKKYLEKAMK